MRRLHRLLRGHPWRPLHGQPKVCVVCDWQRFPYPEFRPPRERPPAGSAW